MYVDEGGSASDSGYESYEVSVAVAGVYGSSPRDEQAKAPSLGGRREREDLHNDMYIQQFDWSALEWEATYPIGENEAQFWPSLVEGRQQRAFRLNQVMEALYSTKVSWPKAKKAKNM